MVTEIVVVVVVAKVLVWAASILNMVVVVEVLFIGVLTDVEVIVVGVIVIILKVALSVPYPLDVSSGLVVDLSMMNALAVVMLDVLTGIGIEADENTNAVVALVTALGFPVSTPSEECSR